MVFFPARSSSISRLSLTTLALLAALAAAGCAKGGGASDAGSKDGAAKDAATAGLPPPPDVAAPPADAVKTASGLATKILSPGTGADHPTQNDSVKVNYSGWTTDGKMFDSSVAPLQPGRPAQPATMPLGRVIPGWTEGMQLMVVGEKRRMWIPVELAYNNKPGMPAGMLVFDIELLDITPGPKPPPDVAAAPADATKLPDGLASKVTQPGTGTAHPGPNDGVRVNYSIWQTDGKFLDGTKAGAPQARPVSGFSDGWAEGLAQMVVGEKRTLWLPAALFNPPGRPPATTDITIVLELLEILAGPKTPSDVKAPPKDATVEKDGLATKVITKGTGTAKPTRAQSVTVKYAGWTTDGKMFDSSYARGEPATFGITGVVPGFGEALQLMVEGEKRRIWIPQDLAYKGRQGAPAGMLVFEVELQKITDTPQRMGGPGMPGGMPPGMGGMGGMHPGMPRPMPGGPQGAPPTPPPPHP
jgi:FKBP-type peptidyl-prolyl cis-trans isomerase